MNRLKEPKTFHYPRLYFQAGDVVSPARIRILYPDGTSEWLLYGHPDSSYAPCWTSKVIAVPTGAKGSDITARTALVRMRRYDKRMRFAKAYYLGELK